MREKLIKKRLRPTIRFLNDKKYVQLSLLFYEYLNSKDDSFLKEHDYSRDEILDGLKYIADIHGYGSLIQVLTEKNN